MKIMKEKKIIQLGKSFSQLRKWKTFSLSKKEFLLKWVENFMINREKRNSF